ncbi:MAG: hypothetical protein E7422_08670 [Ruminococcaceae bacterium]|nr:hypothetical protein [Oscillospiraceae bacterium]
MVQRYFVRFCASGNLIQLVVDQVHANLLDDGFFASRLADCSALFFKSPVRFIVKSSRKWCFGCICLLIRRILRCGSKILKIFSFLQYIGFWDGLQGKKKKSARLRFATTARLRLPPHFVQTATLSCALTESKIL